MKIILLKGARKENKILRQWSSEIMSIGFKLNSVIFAFQYKYRDLTVRETVNVITLYKDLKPVLDSYGEFMWQEHWLLWTYSSY